MYSGTSTTEPPPVGEPDGGRPGWLVPVIIAVVVLLVAGGVVAAVLLGGDEQDPVAAPTAEQTVIDEATAPAGEPTEETAGPEETTSPEQTAEEPITEGATTPEPAEEPTPEPADELLGDLDTSVSVGDLTFELVGEFSAVENILADGAIEAWVGTFTSADEGIELLATLWADNNEADQYAAERVEAAGENFEELETGVTYTNGMGTYWAFLRDNGMGTYIWTTDRGHVLQVTGDTSYVGDFYSAFPL